MFFRLHVLPLGSERGDSLLDLWTHNNPFISTDIPRICYMMFRGGFEGKKQEYQ
jgi:hypothetical protein